MERFRGYFHSKKTGEDVPISSFIDFLLDSVSPDPSGMTEARMFALKHGLKMPENRLEAFKLIQVALGKSEIQ